MLDGWGCRAEGDKVGKIGKTVIAQSIKNTLKKRGKKKKGNLTLCDMDGPGEYCSM